MPSDERREAIVAAPQRRGGSPEPPARRSTRRRGRAHRSAAARSRSPANCVGPAQDRVDQTRARRRTGCRRAARPTRRSAVWPLTRPPAADGIEVLEARSRADPSARGSSRTTGWRDAAPSPRASSAPCRVFVVGFQRAPERRAAAAAAACRARCPASTCRAAPARCGAAYDVTVRMLAWPSRPRRGVIGQRHAPELIAVDVRDAVVPGEPLVDERVVGGQQVEHAAVLRARCSRRTARFRGASRAAGSRRSRGTAADRGGRRRRSAGTATAPRSCRRARSARGSASIRLTCRSSIAGSLRAPRAASVEQLVVGNAAPQEERQARRQLEVADRAHRRRRRRARARRGRGNAGLTSSRSSARWMPPSKPPSARPPRGRTASAPEGPRRRPAAGTRARQRRDDLLSRRPIPAACPERRRGACRVAPRLAREDPPAARRVARSGCRCSGPLIVTLASDGCAARRAWPGAAERAQHVLGERRGLLDEGRPMTSAMARPWTNRLSWKSGGACVDQPPA